jgi:hypothetical protein
MAFIRRKMSLTTSQLAWVILILCLVVRRCAEVMRERIALFISFDACAEERNARDSRASVLEHAGFHEPHLREAGRVGAVDHDTRFGWKASSRLASAQRSPKASCAWGE